VYTGDHVDPRICAVCGNTLTPPSEGGCWICWHSTGRGLLVKDESGNGFVHQQCLDHFDVDDIREYEREYIDDGRVFSTDMGWHFAEQSAGDSTDEQSESDDPDE